MDDVNTDYLEEEEGKKKEKRPSWHSIYITKRKKKKKVFNFTTELKRKLIWSIAYVIHKMRFVD